MSEYINGKYDYNVTSANNSSISDDSDDINLEKIKEPILKFKKKEKGNTKFDLPMQKNDKSINKKRYQLGSRRGNTREILATSVMVGRQSSYVINFNGTQLSFPVNQNSSYSNTTDNYIDDSRQVGRGDCFFMAEINAIRNTKAGQNLLTQNLKKHKDGSYTITLPGALIIRQKYEAKGLPCEVTGTYHIPKAALEKAGSSKYYSKGDLEVVAFELAMEAYRAEMYLTNKANNTTEHFGTAESGINTQEIRQSGDVLHGGYTYDAAFLLSGQKSEVFSATKKRYNSVKPYKDGQYGYITRAEMARRTNADISMYKEKAGIGVSEISHYTQNEQEINSILNKYEGKEGQYALTFGVRVAKNGPDGATLAGNGHALTIVKITKDTIYVANPWHPDKIEPIPRNEFIKMTTSLVTTPINTSGKTNQTNNQQFLNDLNRIFNARF